MDNGPSTYRIFDSTDKILHLAGGVLLVATLFSGSAGPLHGALGLLLLLLFAAHAVKGVSGWLAGTRGLTLLAAPSDLAALGRGVLANLGIGPAVPKTPRSYRQRLPYTLLAVSVPLLALTGVLAAFPRFAAAQFGPGGLVLAAGLHGFFAWTAGAALLWHVVFSHFLGGSGPNLSVLFTGVKSREEFLEKYPDVVEAEASAKEEPEEEKSGPGVEELLSAGNRLAAAGDFSAAAGAFREALEKYPGYPQALFNLGACLYKLGDNRGAATSLNQYLEQDAFGPASERARELLRQIAAGEGGK